MQRVDSVPRRRCFRGRKGPIERRGVALLDACALMAEHQSGVGKEKAPMRGKTVLLALLLSLSVAWGVQAGDSPKIRPPETNDIVVTSAAGSGSGTLRDAVERATPGTTITFDPAVFSPDDPTTIFKGPEPLPFITRGELTIDASDAGVSLDGSSLPVDADGIVITSDGNVIKGLHIVRRGGPTAKWRCHPPDSAGCGWVGDSGTPPSLPCPVGRARADADTRGV